MAAIIKVVDRESLECFCEEYNDETYDGGWWSIVLTEPKHKPLKSLVSQKAYDEIVEKLKEIVGENVFTIVFPAVEKALEEGDANVRKEILLDFLDVDSVRVCSHCGEIIDEGWYLDHHGYACSDECCRELMNISKEDFDRYSIYKDDIEEYLNEEGKGRKPENLTEKEIASITEGIIENLDAYFYTDWG